MYSFQELGKSAVIPFTALMVALVMNGATQFSVRAHDTPLISATEPAGPQHMSHVTRVPAGAVKSPQISSVLNAASFTSTLARGSLASIFGANFTPQEPASATSMPLPDTLAGVSVTVGGVAAPLLYVSGTEINFQVPFEVLAGNSANVVVTGTSASASFKVPLADYAVGIFTYGDHDPVIVHAATNAMVTSASPAVPNETVVAYGTGIGKLHNPPSSGSASANSKAMDSPTATVGGKSARVIFAGLTPGSVGLAQFNIQIPATIPSGNLPLVITFPGDVSPAVNLAVKGNTQAQLSDNTLALFLASVGGGGTDYTIYGTIDVTSFLFSMVLPTTKEWVVLGKWASYSYAPISMDVFAQDSQVYEVLTESPGTATEVCNFSKFNPITGKVSPGPGLPHGCDLSHFGFVGKSIYLRLPVYYDLFNGYVGGEFQVITNGKATTLLSRKDPDNQATMDVADHGILYAIIKHSDNGPVDVWTRNLTTGHLDTHVRNYLFAKGMFKGMSFRINNGILYIGAIKKADNSFEIWTTDLSVPSSSAPPLQLLQSYPASVGTFDTKVNVDNGKVAIAFSSSSMKHGMAVFDVATGSTQYCDMGAKTEINSFAPLWIPGP